MRYLAMTLMAAVSMSVAAQQPLSDTKYDWSGLASSITAGCTTPYDKHHAIYRWLCDNIAYDTSYSIYTADECYEQRRGVCQAYSELFCRLAEAEGLQADLVVGKSKSKDGIDDIGHAWVFAYTDPTTGILIDPTWGAGSVNNGKFTHQPGDETWFHVPPEWMLFTHFPDDERYQLTSNHITFEQFAAIPEYKPWLRLFGYDGAQTLRDALAGKRIDVPECYGSALNTYNIKYVQMPMQSKLRVGERYQVALRTNVPVEDVKTLGKASGAGNDGIWERQGDVIVGLVTPARQGDFDIAIRNKQGSFTTVVSYQVDAPTSSDIVKLESHSPHLSPIWESVKNFTSAEHLAERYVAIGDLLATVRAQNIKELPVLYDGPRYGIQSIPWQGTLRVGQTYHFEFLPYEGLGCAVINEDSGGGTDWYQEWHQDPVTRAWCIDVTPSRAGTLTLAIKTSAEGHYGYCIGYNVR